MKSCSTCGRTYTDQNLSFCIDDGTPLANIEEDESTVVSPRGSANQGGNDWNSPYQPPGTYVPPGGQATKRRAWPWIVGTLGAFILGILAISIAAAVFLPRLLRSVPPDEANSNVETTNSNQSENANVAEPVNSNTDTAEDLNAPPPSDHAQVLAQLTELENEWTVANLNADKKKLERILADDYVGPASEEGGLQSKAEYIRTIRRDVEVDRFEFRDLKLMLTGDRATLTGNLSYVFQGREQVFDFKDKFVWREGRWQATGSEVKAREQPNVNNH